MASLGAAMYRQFRPGGGQLQPGAPPKSIVPYHELFDADFRPRSHYRQLWEHLQRLGQIHLETKARAAQRALRTDGATFTADSGQEAGVEDVGPFDILPRIIPAAEWRPLEAGIKQRVRALNLFLKDIYHHQCILKDGVVPSELIYRGKDFRKEVMDVVPPLDIYTHICGVELIRDEAGRYLVLEDNLRTPSGVHYMIENRAVQRRALPELFARYRVRRIEHYPERLLRALRQLSPRGEDAATIVVLTPGIHNSAFVEHSFLAREMGVELAEGHDLICRNDKVYLKTTHGLRQVDVIYRRIDDDYLDPAVFRPDSLLGVPGIISAWRAGQVALANAPGSGIADDRAVYAYVPEIIRYYLGESALLQSVPTYQMTDPQDRTYVLDNLDKMVIKTVSGSGGHGMLMGPNATLAERAEIAQAILEEPRNYVAQPVIQISRHTCLHNGALESRHLGLRPFVIYGKEIEVVPGALARVAMRSDPLVVSPFHGGGSKDTWVLAD